MRFRSLPHIRLLFALSACAFGASKSASALTPDPPLLRGKPCPGILVENANEDSEYYKISYEKDHVHLRFYRCTRGDATPEFITYENTDKDACKLIARKDVSFPVDVLRDEITPKEETGKHKAKRILAGTLGVVELGAEIMSPVSSAGIQIGTNAINKAKDQLDVETPAEKMERKFLRSVVDHALQCRNWTVAEVQKNNLFVKKAGGENKDNMDLNLPSFDQEGMDKEFRIYLGEIVGRHSEQALPPEAVIDRTFPAPLEFTREPEKKEEPAAATSAITVTMPP